MGSKIAWKYGIKGARGVMHRRPVLHGDVVLCTINHGQGSVFHGSLAALDADTGEEIWRFDTNHFLCQPIVGADCIVVSCFDGTVYKLDMQGNVIWKSRPGTQNIWSGLIMGDVYVYAEMHGGARFTRGLSMEDGSTLWEYENGGHAYSLGSDHKHRVVHSSASRGFDSDDSQLFCFDSASGKLLWKYKHDDYLFRPLIVNDYVVVGSQHSVFVFDLQSGDLLTQQDLGEYVGITEPPIAFGNDVIVLGDHGQIWCMRITTAGLRLFGRRRTRLEQLWHLDLSAKLKVKPLLRGDELLVISEAGELVRIDARDGTISGQEKLPYFKEGYGMVAIGNALIAAVSKDCYRLQNIL